MPGFHHKETKRLLIITGPVKIIDSSVLITSPEEIPSFEWNQLFDFPVEIGFENNKDYKSNTIDKVSMFHYFKSFQKGDPLWITRFESGAPQKTT